NGDKKEHYHNLLNFITPVIKAYCSHMGFRVCETALQCLGGYGYTKDYPLEQYLRDVKIMSLYEGTNGIQSIDLMGRKVNLKNGIFFKAFKSELESFCRENWNHSTLEKEIQFLSKAIKKLNERIFEMSERFQSDRLQWASYTYPTLLCFGDVTLAWRLLDMAIIAQRIMDAGKKNEFYLAKVMQATYFTGVVLPQTLARLDTCTRNGREILEMPEKGF
ncbi:MAG: acyl-CoA dehydrogenase C-terminal domain-containing protein, partial [Deltaproteobacteria bacterium]|nr:acyl-CoA dehydrogenase C-terminal domain-containing protein [Deltaproteobacteria bacterium]